MVKHIEGTSRRLPLALSTLATLAILLGSQATGEAVTRWVNDNGPYSAVGISCSKPQYSTIQAAVNAANPGDDVHVCPGVYHENVVIATKSVSVIATAPAPPATVVKAVVGTPVFQITATGVTVQNFTIVPDDQDIGVAVYIDGSALVMIADNAVLGGRIGVNLGCTSSRSLVANNTVNGQTEAGINVDTCELDQRRPLPGSSLNKIYGNVACSVTSTASIALGGNSNSNQIRDNVATSISVFGKANSVVNNVTQAVIVAQSGGNTLSGNTADPAVCTVTVP